MSDPLQKPASPLQRREEKGEPRAGDNPAGTGAGPARYTLFLKPRWFGQFLGRTILRFCPEAKLEQPCEGCELWAVCKCAQEDLRAAMRVERTVWALIGLCAALILVYCVI